MRVTWCLDSQAVVERPGPVWTLQWNILQNKTSDTLAVGCWDSTLSFYDLSGKQVCPSTSTKWLRPRYSLTKFDHYVRVSFGKHADICKAYYRLLGTIILFDKFGSLKYWVMAYICRLERTRNLVLILAVSHTTTASTSVWVAPTKRCIIKATSISWFFDVFTRNRTEWTQIPDDICA